jgi:putative FmdB family regulatory protein
MRPRPRSAAAPLPRSPNGPWNSPPATPHFAPPATGGALRFAPADHSSTEEIPTVPIYEYQCEACGHELEAMQSIKDPPLVECPACHARSLRKRISAAGFRLKGSGWYVTDFRDGGKKKDTGTGSKEAPKTDSAGEGSTTAAAASAPAASTSSSDAGAGTAAPSGSGGASKD